MKCSFVMMIVVSLILLINSPVVMAGCCRRAVETKLLKEEQNGVNAESDCVRFRSRIRSTIDFFLCIMHNTNHKLSQKCTIILQIHQSTSLLIIFAILQGIIDPCQPPGGNDGDRQASCNAKGCFYASEEDCDYMCRTVEISHAELQSGDEGTGWSSKLRVNEK